MKADDAASTLSRMAGELRDQQNEEQTVSTVLDQARALLPSADHVSITMRVKRGRYSSAGASSDLAQQAEQLQFTLGEGPCVDAAAPSGDGWLRSADVANDPRWPKWGPAAAALGVASVMSVQLLAHKEPFGSVNLYSEQSGQFVDDDETDLALLWATHAAAALRSAHQQTGLSTAIQSRHLIGVAQGIVIERYNLDLSSSFDFLNRIASQRDEKVREVARYVVENRQLPPHD